MIDTLTTEQLDALILLANRGASGICCRHCRAKLSWEDTWYVKAILLTADVRKTPRTLKGGTPTQQTPTEAKP